jgi:DNA-binding response OmpR family regulator
MISITAWATFELMINSQPVVLVVEDDYFLANELASMLEGAGAVTLGPAADVATALGLIEHSDPKPDLAVLDINLNGALVFAVADELARLDIPFLFASGSKIESVPEEHRDRPFCEKPISQRALIAFMHVALRRHSASEVPPAVLPGSNVRRS